LANGHRPVPQRRSPRAGRRRARRTIPRRRLPAAARRVTGARAHRGGGVMTTTLAPARPEAAAARATFAALATRETRRFVLNPVLIAAAGLTAYLLWSGQRSTVTEIDSVNASAATLFAALRLMPPSRVSPSIPAT